MLLCITSRAIGSYFLYPIRSSIKIHFIVTMLRLPVFPWIFQNTIMYLKLVLRSEVPSLPRTSCYSPILIAFFSFMPGMLSQFAFPLPSQSIYRVALSQPMGSLTTPRTSPQFPSQTFVSVAVGPV